MRQPLRPGTSSDITLTELPAHGNRPARWSARVVYCDDAGRIRHLRTVGPDPDAAADALDARLDELGLN